MAQSAMLGSQSMAIAAQSTLVASLSTAISKAESCGVKGQAYAAGSCINTNAFVPVATSELMCTTALVSQLRIINNELFFCDGTAWRTASPGPLGSTFQNPGMSCAAIIAAGGYGTPGVYFVRVNSTSIARQVCSGSTNLGTIGATKDVPASSCASAQTYFGLDTGFAFIEGTSNPPDPSKAIRVFCNAGVSEGGDGSNAANSASSCSSVISRWSRPTGLYFISGTQTFVAAEYHV